MTKILAALLLAGLAFPALAEDQVIDFATDDPEMNAAIDKARASLPEFWTRLADPAPNESDFSVKLGIQDGPDSEHMWCNQIEGDQASASCVISNQPVYVTSVRYGERVEIDPAIISDWLYYRDDLIVGAETIRVMLPYLEKKDAAAMRAQLAEP